MTPSPVKRTMRKKLVRRKNFQAIPRTFNSTGFPKMLKINHKYVECGIQSNYTAAGSCTVYKFSVNNLFDPNTTGTGHQPSYFDTVSGLYDHYCVIGSRIKIKVIPANITSSPIGPCVATMWIDDNASTSLTRVQACAEQASATPIRVFGGTNAHDDVIFTKVWSARQAFGPNPLSNDKLVGASGAAPTEQQYFAFAWEANDLAGSTVYLNVEVEYITIWTELKEVAQS